MRVPHLLPSLSNPSRRTWIEAQGSALAKLGESSGQAGCRSPRDYVPLIPHGAGD